MVNVQMCECANGRLYLLSFKKRNDAMSLKHSK